METIWSPPYPDGKDWEDEKEKDEAELKDDATLKGPDPDERNVSR